MTVTQNHPQPLLIDLSNTDIHHKHFSYVSTITILDK